MDKEKIISKTVSVCPVCLKQIPAYKVEEDDGIYLEKTCPEHGDFRVLIWHDTKESYYKWDRVKKPPVSHFCHTHVDKGCPYDCGLCEAHLQQPCCVLLEVTQRCNLHCPVCFASAGDASMDPSMEEIGSWYDELMRAGGPFNIQLSGGEPSMRDDLADIIRLGKSKGFSYFQLNTNGIRIAEDFDYLKNLVDAGLKNVFLQFDGLTNHPYEVLRGAPLLETKLKAIENCSKVKVGLTLVPTVAPGVNDDQIGDILNFALDKLPVVRCVHFQPVSYFGRCGLEHGDQRITIPDMLNYMEEQTQGKMKRKDFVGGGAENSYCSFHANFMLMPDGEVRALKSDKDSPESTTIKKSREFVAKHWSAAPKVASGLFSSQEGFGGIQTGFPSMPKPKKVESCTCGMPSHTETKVESCTCGMPSHTAEKGKEGFVKGFGDFNGIQSGFPSMPKPKKVESCTCGMPSHTEEKTETCSCQSKAKEKEEVKCSCDTPQEESLFDVFLDRVENYTLAVSGMLFQDAWNFDLDRVRRCKLCEFSPNKKIVPFCAYNLSSISGETLHRGK